MGDWKKGGRRDAIRVDLDALVPADHLLRKIGRVMATGYMVVVPPIVVTARPALLPGV